MKTPTLHLEQIALGERTNPGTLNAELQDIETSSQEILAQYPVAMMEALVKEKLTNNKKSKKSSNTIPFTFPRTFGLVAAACFVMVFSFGIVKTLRGVDGSEITGSSGVLELTDRAKGNGAALFVYRKEGTNAVMLRSYSLVHEGDILQLSYVASGDTYGTIISIDGKGVISRHFPDDGNMAGKLNSKGEIPLGFSFQLDNAPAYERFILISGKREFSVTSIINSIQSAGRFAMAATSDLSGYLPAGVRMTEILLLK